MLLKDDLQHKIRRKCIQKCIFALFFYALSPYDTRLFGTIKSAVKSAFPLQKRAQLLHFWPLLHDAFMTGARIGCFHHSCVCVSQQISHQSGTHSSLFQLRAEGRTPVMVIELAVNTQLFEGAIVGSLHRGVRNRCVFCFAVDNKPARPPVWQKKLFQRIRNDESGRLNKFTIIANQRFSFYNRT